MSNKEMLSQPIPIIHETISQLPFATNNKNKNNTVLGKILLWLRGKKETKTFTPDPAADVIALIADQTVASIVKDLHYKTPRSLLAMRKSCQECFMLPDDCPYYDYSIFDVKKAIKKLAVHPRQIQFQVVKELKRVNSELAHHLTEYLE